MLIVFFILASFTQLYSAIAEQDVPLSLAKLGWYLPLSPGNYEFQGVTQDSRYIFVTDQRSFSGIDIDTGAYTFNTTFQDKILCSKLVENKFVSVHGQGQLVISAFDFDGSPRFTVELNETFTSSESASCFLAQSGNDILLFRNGEPRVSLITADGHISWTRTVSKAGFHFYRIDGNQKSGNVMVSGKGHGQIRLVFLSLSDGMVTNEVSLTTSSTELPAVLETEDKLVLVYTEGDQLYGYDLTAQMKYLLDTGAVGQDANGRGAASLEAWPYANSLSDSFFLRYSDGISFLILMKSVVDIEIHEIEPIGDSLQIPSRDNEPYAAIFTHLEEDKRYVLEIMELSTGQVIERHLLEDLFPNEIIAGHFQSLIDNDGYFAWKFYTMDASGGFASYHSDEISKAPMTRTDDDSTPLIDEISHDEL